MSKEISTPEVYKINDNIYCFYLGRDVTGECPIQDEGNWVILDWNWGVCSYVLFVPGKEKAIVFDTGVYPDYGLWIRNFMAENEGIKEFVVVTSHWHLDHIAGNEHYADCEIIASRPCREEMVKISEKVEEGKFWGAPALKMVYPTITFENSLSIWLYDIEVKLERFHIHTPDSIAAFIPKFDMCLCGDMLEDTQPFVLDVADLEIQKKELERMKSFEASVFYPCHGNPHKIKNGGYDRKFIDAVIEYDTNLVAMHDHPDYINLPVEAFIPNAIENGTLSVWKYYVSVHEGNKKLVKEYFAEK